jgi:hypothetical protein
MSTKHIFVLETAFQDANSAKLTISCPVDKINDIMSIIVDYNNNKNTIPINKPKKIKVVEINNLDDKIIDNKIDEKRYPTQCCHTCYDDGIKKFSSYCFSGSSRPVRCAKHKEHGMVPVPSRCCQNEGCKKTASYNFQNVAGVVYCMTHKTEGMISKTNKKVIPIAST